METGQSYLEVYCAAEMRSHSWTALVAVLDITIAAVILKLPVLSVQMVSRNLSYFVSHLLCLAAVESTHLLNQTVY